MSFIGQTADDRILAQTLKKVLTDVTASRSSNAVINALRPIKRLKQEVRDRPDYRGALFLLLAYIAILFGWILYGIGILTAVAMLLNALELPPILYVFFVFLAFLYIPKGFKRVFPNAKFSLSFGNEPLFIAEISDQISEHHALICHHLTKTNNDKALLAEQRKFSSYQIGDAKSRDFLTLAEGKYAGKEHQFAYSYFHFFSSIRHDDRTVRCNLYGVNVDFKFAKNILIAPSKSDAFWKQFPRFSAGDFFKLPQSWRSSSITFNQIFQVSASDPQAAAKFLRPEILQTIEGLSNELEGLALEFNETGGLCLSCLDSDLIEPPKKEWAEKRGLEDIDEFILDLKESRRHKKLNGVLNHIHTLMKYSDNNFEQNNQ